MDVIASFIRLEAFHAIILITTVFVVRTRLHGFVQQQSRWHSLVFPLVSMTIVLLISPSLMLSYLMPGPPPPCQLEQLEWCAYIVSAQSADPVCPCPRTIKMPIVFKTFSRSYSLKDDNAYHTKICVDCAYLKKKAREKCIYQRLSARRAPPPPCANELLL